MLIPIWSNHDILNEDDSVFFKGTPHNTNYISNDMEFVYDMADIDKVIDTGMAKISDETIISLEDLSQGYFIIDLSEGENVFNDRLSCISNGKINDMATTYGIFTGESNFEIILLSVSKDVEEAGYSKGTYIAGSAIGDGVTTGTITFIYKKFEEIFFTKRSTYKNIANSVRAKTGKTEEILIENIPGEIDKIGGMGSDGVEKYFEDNYNEVILPNAKKIKSYAFFEDKTLTTIAAPKANSIGDYAFSACTNLALAELSDGLTEIGTAGFSACVNLALTELPKSLVSIGNYAFQGCSNLALTKLPRGLTNIGSSTFSGCINLTLTELPEDLTSIGGSAFANCQNLALTELPNGLTSLGNNGFNGCKSLALTKLPEGLVTIDSYAFYDCDSLALTKLPEGLTSIKDRGFYSCDKLALTELPNGLTSIGTYAFYYCRSLALTELPESLVSIGSCAFSSCTGLTSITFKGKPTSLYADAFYNCTKLTTINVPWAEGEVSGAPWGATNATINYNYTGE